MVANVDENKKMNVDYLIYNVHFLTQLKNYR